MIDIRELIARLRLASVLTRYREYEQAWEIALGTYCPANGELMPEVREDAGNPRYRAYLRALRQIQGDGPRIIEVKLGAVVGAVTWGGGADDERQTDEHLAALNLPTLASALAEAVMVGGIAAVMAHRDLTDAPRITPLGGYLEPYTDPRDRDRVTGLFQADTFLDTHGRMRWWARVYDFEDPDEAVIRVWDALDHPAELGFAPSRTIGRETDGQPAPVPRFRIRRRTRDGLVLSEMITGAPFLRALWATEMRLLASEEMTAQPMLRVIGDVDVSGTGPGEVLSGEAGSSAEWIEPGNLEQLRAQHELRRQRVERHFSMPGGQLGSGMQPPSGVAIQEANRLFQQNAQSYASSVGELLTEVVADYALLAGIDPVPVVVGVNQEFMAEARIAFLERADNLGALPFPVLAREIQTLVGGSYSDTELGEFIEAKQAERQSFLAQMGGGAAASADDPG